MRQSTLVSAALLFAAAVGSGCVGCQPLSPTLGTPCTSDSQCGLGVCASGACTNGATEPCASASHCASAVCTDGKCAAGQPPGTTCSSPTACSTQACPAGTCQSGSRDTGASCSSGGQCRSGVCSAGACRQGVGDPCTASAQCVVGTCEGGTCRGAPGTPCAVTPQCGAYVCVAGTCQSSDAGGSAACRRVDLVISVDNSGSMSEEQKEMRTIFPKLATALATVGNGLEDFRVGVDDACPFPASFQTRGRSGPCSFQSGKVWMDSRSTALSTEFACVGEISSADAQCTGSNDDEQPASTAAATLEAPAKTGPNAGFLRDDAVLVVMALTDEDEKYTPAPMTYSAAQDHTAQQMYDRLVATKGGNVKRMVFLGVGGQQACSGVYGTAAEAVKLKAVTALFQAQGRGIFWDLCQGKLEDGLGAAVSLVSQACFEFPRTGGTGTPCSSPGQCNSGRCTNGLCEGPGGTDGGPGKPDGSPCSEARECQSFVCVNGKCEPGIN